MKDIEREDLYILSQHSNLSEQSLERMLKDNVYRGKKDWQSFLRYFLISMGVGFSVAGIIFFFAYNWDSLDKFVKLSLTQALVVIVSILAVHPRIRLDVRKILLTGASVLVGVMFAVYGQIYQTGADAYDLFLIWTIGISLWVFVANFAPLWLLYLVLINTSFILYSFQVAESDFERLIVPILFIGNALVLLLATLLYERKKNLKIPNWLLVIIGLSVVLYGTWAAAFEVVESTDNWLLVLGSTCLFYGLGLWYGIKRKNVFYLSAIPFSIVIILSIALYEWSSSYSMLLVIGLLFISATSLIIRNLLRIQKTKE